MQRFVKCGTKFKAKREAGAAGATADGRRRPTDIIRRGAAERPGRRGAGRRAREHDPDSGYFMRIFGAQGMPGAGESGRFEGGKSGRGAGVGSGLCLWIISFGPVCVKREACGVSPEIANRK